MNALRRFWAVLRRLTGDDAYERYLAHHRSHHSGALRTRAPMSRAEFFRAEQARKWSGGPQRCC